MRIVGRFAAIALASSLLGCTAQRIVQAYPGPELPTVEVARIVVSDPGIFADEHQGVYIIAVDGIGVMEKSLFWERVVSATVKPGPHSVTFGYYGGNSFSTSPATLFFNAEAGKTYELHAADAGSLGDQLLAALTTQGEWQAWITDKTTGEVVAGQRPD